MTSKLQFRQGYEKPLHYPCTILIKVKPDCSFDKRLYCDISSVYFRREKDWDICNLKDKIEWWCYATDLERYIKQSQKDLEIARKALVDARDALEGAETSLLFIDFKLAAAGIRNEITEIDNTLEQIEHKE